MISNGKTASTYVVVVKKKKQKKGENKKGSREITVRLNRHFHVYVGSSLSPLKVNFPIFY